MIIRKATKIELKPEEDYQEYEDYKSEQTKKLSHFKMESSELSPMQGKNGLKLNLLNDMFKSSNSNNKISSVCNN